MAFMTATGFCFACNGIFTFNPNRVPSVRVNDAGQADPEGQRVPICQACVEKINPRRIANGLPPIHILPGAYDAEEIP